MEIFHQTDDLPFPLPKFNLLPNRISHTHEFGCSFIDNDIGGVHGTIDPKITAHQKLNIHCFYEISAHAESCDIGL